MASLLLNPKQAEIYNKDGYVIIPSFLSNKEVEALKNQYENLEIDQNSPFHSSSFHPNFETKKILNTQSEKIVANTVNSIFTKHKALGTSFLTKQPGENSAMPIHQDWTVVDESKFNSITCWIPLQDTNIKNGAIQVIPGSHLFENNLRSPSLPIAFESIYLELKPYLKTLELKQGDAFIFNHALMHASHPNLTDKPRVAFTYGLTNVEAQLQMYYQKENKVQKWHMPDDMFLNYPKIRQSPQIGELIKELDYEIKQLNLAMVQEKIMQHRKERKMKPLFKNSKQQEEFEQNGYIKLNALNQKEVNQLKALYAELNLKDEKGYGFHVGMDNKDKNLVQNMVTQIKEIALPKVAPYLTEMQTFTASFVVKDPNPQGVVPPHQDWSFVKNEEDYCSVTCWIPLQDVNINNGCLGVIDGSVHFFDSVRPSPSPQVGTPLKDHMFTIFPFLKLIEMKAGEALFFNNKTIHASPPNITNQARLAVGLGFTQKEAEICHYFLKPGTTDTLLQYNIDADFFLKYDNAQLSEMYEKGKLIEGYGTPTEVPFHFEDLSAEVFTKKMQDAGNTYNAPLVATMAKLFNYNTDGTPKQEEDKKEQIETINTSNNIEVKAPFWKVYTPLNIVREIYNRINPK